MSTPGKELTFSPDPNLTYPILKLSMHAVKTLNYKLS